MFWQYQAICQRQTQAVQMVVPFTQLLDAIWKAETEMKLRSMKCELMEEKESVEELKS